MSSTDRNSTDSISSTPSLPDAPAPGRASSVLKKVLSFGKSSPQTLTPLQESDLSLLLPPLPPIRLLGLSEKSRRRLMDLELAGDIRNLMPPRLQLYREWELVYSTDRDGISLQTLYRNCDPVNQLKLLRKDTPQRGFADLVVSGMIIGSRTHSTAKHGRRHHGYVMVVLDQHNRRFGCFLNEHLKLSGNKRYYGNGDCFLWKCEHYTPHDISPAGSGASLEQDCNNTEETKEQERFKAFMHTGLNSNIVYSNLSFVAIGSSQGNNGLWIDKSLDNGVSCKCDTFGNEVLCDSGLQSSCQKFKIIALQVWRVGLLED